MSSRRRLTRPTALLAAVFVVLGVGGGASALGEDVANESVSQTVMLPGVKGGSVHLCIKRGTSEVACKTTPEPLIPGGTLTVTAGGSAGATLPVLTVVPNPTCPEDGMSGVMISVTPGAGGANVSAKVVGTGTLSAEETGTTVGANVPAEAPTDVLACVKAPSTE